jgi:hypothetical protein
MFPSLLALSGEAGARDLIRGSAAPIETVEFSGGNVDVDTPADYERLLAEPVIGAPSSGAARSSDARAPPVR